jgi:hypothetical protein
VRIVVAKMRFGQHLAVDHKARTLFGIALAQNGAPQLRAGTARKTLSDSSADLSMEAPLHSLERCSRALTQSSGVHYTGTQCTKILGKDTTRKDAKRT